jgi:hypothetical protein
MLAKALRSVTTWLVLVALSVSFVWQHDERLVGEDVGWLQLGLVAAVVAYLGYVHLQASWERGQIGRRDGWAAFGGLSTFAVGLGVAIVASTTKARFDVPRDYSNLFALLVLAGVSAAGDAVWCQERYKRAHGGALPLSEELAPEG